MVDDLDASVEMVSGSTRSGFEVPFWIDFKNQGTVIADAAVFVTLDPLVSFVSSYPIPDSIVGNNVYWNIENIPPTHSGQEFLKLVKKAKSIDNNLTAKK